MNQLRPWLWIGKNGPGILEYLRAAAWNVQGLTCKEVELKKELNNKAIDIVVISKTKKNKGSIECAVIY
jgi:hypothetical protein